MKKEIIKEQKKTKILAIGDLHGDEALAKRIAKQAKDENVDLVIIAGDLTLLEQPAKNIVGPFIKENKEVLIIPGNHESMSTIRSFAEFYPKTKHIHGYSVNKNGVGIFGAGYDSKVGPFWIEDEEIFKLLKKGHENIKDTKKKIMVTHAHPSESIAEFSGAEGSKAVRKALHEFKPDVLISGHIHGAGGLQEKIGKTKVFHVARKPAIFEI